MTDSRDGEGEDSVGKADSSLFQGQGQTIGSFFFFLKERVISEWQMTGHVGPHSVMGSYGGPGAME